MERQETCGNRLIYLSQMTWLSHQYHSLEESGGFVPTGQSHSAQHFVIS